MAAEPLADGATTGAGTETVGCFRFPEAARYHTSTDPATTAMAATILVSVATPSWPPPAAGAAAGGGTKCISLSEAYLALASAAGPWEEKPPLGGGSPGPPWLSPGEAVPGAGGRPSLPAPPSLLLDFSECHAP